MSLSELLVLSSGGRELFLVHVSVLEQKKNSNKNQTENCISSAVNHTDKRTFFGSSDGNYTFCSQAYFSHRSNCKNALWSKDTEKG